MRKAFGYLEKFDLSKRSTIRLGPLVDAFFPDSEEELIELLSYFDSSGRNCVIVGGLSNLLPSEDPDSHAYVFTDGLRDFALEETSLTLGAGCRLTSSILRAAKEGRFFAPSLVGIPGTVGGAVFSNAGAFGEEIGDRVICCRVYDRIEKRIRVLSSADMRFSYRHSFLKERSLVLLKAVLSLDDSLGKTSFYERVAEVKRRRFATQPHEPSLGSVFKAHEGVSVGYYLDRLGLKGYSSFGIAVSEMHAGFLVNRGGSISAMKRMVSYLKNQVLKAYGFLPEEEIQIL